MINQRISKRIPSNPFSWPLAIAGFLTLLLIWLSTLMDREWFSYLAIRLMPFACMLLLLAYTLTGLLLGWIACVGHIGQVYHYQRSQSPVGFWTLILVYLAVSVPAAFYLQQLL